MPFWVTNIWLNAMDSYLANEAKICNKIEFDLQYIGETER